MKKEEKEEQKGLKPEYPVSMIDLRSAIEAFAEGERRAMSVCFPACVRSYDRKTHTAEVLPLIKKGYFTGDWEYKRSDPYTVTVRAIQIGGFSVDVPLYVGDTGWVIASDRDTELLKQDGSLTNSVLEKDRPLKVVDASYPQKPHQPILHDFSRGFFIPDNWGVWDFEKFKDSRNFSVNLLNSLYIGASVGTRDRNILNDDEETVNELVETLDELKEDYEESKKNGSSGTIIDEDDFDVKNLAKKMQVGSEYWKRTTSSVILGRDGSLHLMSGSPDSPSAEGWGATGYGRITIQDDTVEYNICGENGYNGGVTCTVSPEFGISLRQDGDIGEFYITTKNGVTTIQSVSGGRRGLLLSITNGELIVDSSNGMNIIAEDNVSLKTKKDLSVFANTVNVMATDGADIKAGGDVSIYANTSVNVHTAGAISMSGANLDIAAKYDVIISSGGSIDLQADTIKFEVLEGYGQVLFNGENSEVGKFIISAPTISMKNPDGGSVSIQKSAISMNTTEREISISGGNKLNVVGTSINVGCDRASISGFYAGSVATSAVNWDPVWTRDKEQLKAVSSEE